METTPHSDIRVAVVGCGYWGRNHVRNYAELGALEALVDDHPGIAEDLAARHGGRVMRFEEVLADPAIQGIVFALPPQHHYALGLRALEAGKHVFVEKPMALAPEQAEEMCDLAERLDRRLMVGHILQYHPAFRELARMVAEGELGRLHHINASRLNLGRIRRAEDAFWALAPHDVSMILSLVGQEPDSVRSVGGFYLHETIADVTTTHLGFPGGVQAQIFVSWLNPFKEQRLTVVGEGAMAVFDDAEPWERKLVVYPHRIEWRDGVPDAVRADPVPVPLTPKEPLREECRHFLDCIRSGATPVTDGREGLRVLKVLQRSSDALAASRDADTASRGAGADQARI